VHEVTPSSQELAPTFSVSRVATPSLQPTKEISGEQIVKMNIGDLPSEFYPPNQPYRELYSRSVESGL
jgi:hypothetical protein